MVVPGTSDGACPESAPVGHPERGHVAKRCLFPPSCQKFWSGWKGPRLYTRVGRATTCKRDPRHPESSLTPPRHKKDHETGRPPLWSSSRCGWAPTPIDTDSRSRPGREARSPTRRVSSRVDLPRSFRFILKRLTFPRSRTFRHHVLFRTLEKPQWSDLQTGVGVGCRPVQRGELLIPFSRLTRLPGFRPGSRVWSSKSPRAV